MVKKKRTAETVLFVRIRTSVFIAYLVAVGRGVG
jgi:hypothetical protein